MPAILYVLLAAAWVSWMAPFLLLRPKSVQPVRLDRRARWGMVLEGVAYWLCWASAFWKHAPEPWRIAAAIPVFAAGVWLAWTAVRTLGSKWRMDAGLNADHELVVSGPYRFIRHPIYASMLCMLLGTGLALTPLYLLVIAVALFIAGTEIRVRVEDSLLASRFPDQFREYRAHVAAYIPFVR
jgi:protein-S-isoprenylcysteine O-methyltransferase Ste14